MVNIIGKKVPSRAKKIQSYSIWLRRSETYAKIAHDPNGRIENCEGDSGGPSQATQTYLNPAMNHCLLQDCTFFRAFVSNLSNYDDYDA